MTGRAGRAECARRDGDGLALGIHAREGGVGFEEGETGRLKTPQMPAKAGIHGPGFIRSFWFSGLVHGSLPAQGPAVRVRRQWRQRCRVQLVRQKDDQPADQRFGRADETQRPCMGTARDAGGAGARGKGENGRGLRNQAHQERDRLLHGDGDMMVEPGHARIIDGRARGWMDLVRDPSRTRPDVVH